MRRRLEIATTALLLTGGCSLVIDAGSYHARDDGGATTMDAATDGGVDGAVDAAIDASTDCDPACGAGERCVDGACQCGAGAGCASGSACCDGACVPLGTITDCAACGDACATGAHASATCASGTCELTCDEGFASCDTADPDCEQSLLSAAHCGGCGNGCAAGELCAVVGGVPTCASSCAAGETECSGACVDTSTNVLHCGRCDNACPEPSSGSARCAGGTCETDCDPGYGLCGGTTCVALVSYWPDGDGDGYGATTAAPIQGCPGMVPANHAATNDDCDDLRAAINPAARETCDGVDEDCDGSIDDGFMCTGSATQACTRTVGTCTVTGTQTCSACTWGECVGVDACDRTDDDCDGFVDEGGFRVDAAQAITPVGMYRPGNVRADYNPMRREVGVVWSELVSGSFLLRFARLDATTGARVGSVTTVVPAGVGGYGIAWDGAHFTVAVVEGGQAILYRVDASTGAVARAATVDPSSGNDIAVARLGTAGTAVAVVWTGGSSRGRLARYTMPAASSGSAAPIGTAQDVITSGFTHYARIASTASGALAFYLVTPSGSGPYDLHVGPVGAGSVGTFARRIAGTVSEIHPRFEPTTNTVGAAISLYVASTNRAVFQSFDATGAMVSPEVPLAGTGAGGLAWAGEPGQLAAFSGMFFPITGDLVRLRVSDRTVLPTAPLRIGDVAGIIGIPEGPVRYLYVGDDGTNINAYPVVCR